MDFFPFLFFILVRETEPRTSWMPRQAGAMLVMGAHCPSQSTVDIFNLLFFLVLLLFLLPLCALKQAPTLNKAYCPVAKTVEETHPPQSRARVGMKAFLSSAPALGPISTQRLFVFLWSSTVLISIWFTECCHFFALYFHNHTFKPDKVQDPECLQLPKIDSPPALHPSPSAEADWILMDRSLQGSEEQLVLEGQEMLVVPATSAIPANLSPFWPWDRLLKEVKGLSLLHAEWAEMRGRILSSWKQSWIFLMY